MWVTGGNEYLRATPWARVPWESSFPDPSDTPPAFVSGRGGRKRAETNTSNTSAQPLGHVYFGKVRFRTPRTPPPQRVSARSGSKALKRAAPLGAFLKP